MFKNISSKSKEATKEVSVKEFTALVRIEQLLMSLIHDMSHGVTYIRHDTYVHEQLDDIIQYKKQLGRIAATSEKLRKKLDHALLITRAIRHSLNNKEAVYELNHLCEIAITTFLEKHWSSDPFIGAGYDQGCRVICNDKEMVDTLCLLLENILDPRQNDYRQLRITLLPERRDDQVFVCVNCRIFFKDKVVLSQILENIQNFIDNACSEYFSVVNESQENIDGQIEIKVTFIFSKTA